MICVADVEGALRAWPGDIESVTPMGGGANSATWLVMTDQGHFVAKLVDPVDAPGLVRGLRIAEFLAARGIPSGPPVHRRTGESTLRLPQGELALLRLEPGIPPDLTRPNDVRRAGRALARAHRVLREFPVESDSHYRWPWEWVERLLTTIPMPEHVNAAARRIWPEIVRTVSEHRLTIGIVHADPEVLLAHDVEPDDENPHDVVIDWNTTMRGPLLYDLACVAVTSRRVPGALQWFVQGYVEQSPELGPELPYLDDLIRARWLANAIYFADRIDRGIRRGSGSPSANDEGLAEAYAGMIAGR